MLTLRLEHDENFVTAVYDHLHNDSSRLRLSYCSVVILLVGSRERKESLNMVRVKEKSARSMRGLLLQGRWRIDRVR